MRYFPSPAILLPSLLLLVPSFVCAQQAGADSSSTVIRVQLDADAKVKLGAPVHARTVDPLYEGSRLLLPAGTPVAGRVSAVNGVSRDKRLDAISHGDFTPLREAKIEFSTIAFSNGVTLPIATSQASQSADVLRFQSSTTKRQSLFHQAWADLTNKKNQTVDMVKAPGRMERLEKMFFAQLPWHPQTIESGTQYDIALLQPIALPANANLPAQAPAKSGDAKTPQSKDSSVLHARLQNDLSSKTAKRDDPVAAVVTEPVLDTQGKIEIPQGATLHGRILQTRAAKKWGKNGALRFTFNRVDFPEGAAPEQVAGVLTAADGSKNGPLKLDAEGGVQPDTNKGLMLPLAMGFLAASSILDEDAGAAKIGVTSNGFGLITRLIAISTGSRYVGAAIGSVATARTIYTRFLAHGRDVTFARNSQIEVDLGPVHSFPRATSVP